ncbi:hypothetical protein [Leisingera sp. NJS204]|uniref:hypothetical protein n=1 Tax=Leisingera sp. NJS204 TaxID=2508307 RepID=UPI001012C344|nr:hypothetical protein [Leisingera sp. NJS204]QAX32150.1 hypothetical protein ETW24_22455 [Leisingera sp. NJS204]
MSRKTQRFLAAGASLFALAAGAVQADQVINDELIVNNSLCVGTDCSNGESFGFDTIRLKENNMRIKFQDTSVSASFPTRDWQLTANSSDNGGGDYFSIDDVDGNTTPFLVEADAGNHAVYVKSGGFVGFGTTAPGVDLHVKQGNSPALRLEQDTSSGFASQTWDVAGNETNFFIRDVSNSGTLPFKIKPGAPSDALVIDSSGIIVNESGASRDLRVEGDTLANLLFVDASADRIGLGTNVPDETLHLASGQARVALQMESSASADDFQIIWNGTQVRFSNENAAAVAMSLTPTGDMTIAGTLITTGGGGACTLADPCDAVFDPEVYTVPSIEEHAAEMWAKKHLPAVGPTGPGIPVNVTEKMLRMLNELEHAHIYIEQLQKRITVLEETVTDQG